MDADLGCMCGAGAPYTCNQTDDIDEPDVSQVIKTSGSGATRPRPVPSARHQCGGRSSQAGQPTASIFRGSTDVLTCSVRPQVEHSDVRISKRRRAGAIRASAIRRLHAGHIGRSLVGLIMTPCPAHRTKWAASVCKIDDSEPDFYGRLNRRNGGGAKELISQVRAVAEPPPPKVTPQGGAALTSEISGSPRQRPPAPF
jgi:hypothetical protein